MGLSAGVIWCTMANIKFCCCTPPRVATIHRFKSLSTHHRLIHLDENSILTMVDAVADQSAHTARINLNTSPLQRSNRIVMLLWQEKHRNYGINRCPKQITLDPYRSHLIMVRWADVWTTTPVVSHWSTQFSMERLPFLTPGHQTDHA